MSFDFRNRGGRIVVNLNIVEEFINNQFGFSEFIDITKITLEILLIIVCLASFIITIRSILTTIKIYQVFLYPLLFQKKINYKTFLKKKETKKKTKSVYLALYWRNLPVRVKMKFFNFWTM